jgi:hypothetical protein
MGKDTKWMASQSSQVYTDSPHGSESIKTAIAYIRKAA